MEKVSNATRAKLRDLKRRKDFDEMILPAKKVARTGAEWQARRTWPDSPRSATRRAAQDLVIVKN